MSNHKNSKNTIINNSNNDNSSINLVEKFSLKFITIDSKTTNEMAALGYNHLLDLTLKRSNKWSNVLVHLTKKWSKVPHLKERISVFFNDVNGNSSVNLAGAFTNHKVWDSLSLHPTLLQLSANSTSSSNNKATKNTPTVLGPDNVPSFIIYYTFTDVKAISTKNKDSKETKKTVPSSIVSSNSSTTTITATTKQKKAEVPVVVAKAAVAKAAVAAAFSIDPKKDNKQPTMPPPQGFLKSPNPKAKAPVASAIPVSSAISVVPSKTSVPVQPVASTSAPAVPSSKHNSVTSTTNTTAVKSNSKPNTDSHVNKKTSKSAKNWFKGVGAVEDNSLFGAVFNVDSNMGSKHIDDNTDNNKHDSNNFNYDNSKQLLDPNIDTNILNMLCELSSVGGKVSNTEIDNNNKAKTSTTTTTTTTSKIDYSHNSKSRLLRSSSTNKTEQVYTDNSNDNKAIAITNTDDTKPTQTLRLFGFINKNREGSFDNVDSPTVKENSPSPCSVAVAISSPQDNKNNNDTSNDKNDKNKRKRDIAETTNNDTTTTTTTTTTTNIAKKAKSENQQTYQNIVTHFSTVVPASSNTKQPIHVPPSRKPHIKRIRPTFLAPLSERHRFIVM